MSKLQELMQELCPNGVEYKKLGDVCEIKTGKGITKADATLGGTYPIISGGQSPMGYYHKTNRCANTVTISRVGAYAGFVSYIEEDFYLNDKCFSVIPTTNILSRFLFYILKNMECKIKELQSEGGVPTINTTKVSNLIIPLPPLAVQEEIVRILDKFNFLAAELQAELQARQQQYEYYRNKLLTFSDIAVGGGAQSVVWKTNSKLHKLIQELCPNGVEYIALEDILDYEQPTKYIVKSTEYNDLYKTPVLTAGQTFILGYTNEEDGIYHANKDNATIIFDDFTTSFHWVDFDFKVKSSAMKMLRPKSNFIGSFKYVYYAMECIGFEAVNHTRHWISQYSKFEIPLPPLAVQEEIVSILDKFETLVNDLSQGLPAEIAAVQEQYEYYRNKLLTFKQVA